MENNWNHIILILENKLKDYQSEKIKIILSRNNKLNIKNKQEDHTTNNTNSFMKCSIAFFIKYCAMYECEYDMQQYY